MRQQQPKKTILSVVLENFILTEIENFRREHMRRTGHMSRSGAIRILVNRGLESFGAEQPEGTQARV